MKNAARIDALNGGQASVRSRVRKLVPSLGEDNDPALDVLLADATIAQLLPQQFVFHSHSNCDSFLILLDGSFRVQLSSSGGREVTLYRVIPGDACALTASCLLNRVNYPAEAIAESTIEAIVITQESFHKALESSPGFRHYVFNVYSINITGIITKIEQLAFMSIDTRLSNALLDYHERGEDRVTHQELAAELGTAREVVSRRLKSFENVGWVRLSRGRIVVSDRTGLENGRR